MRRLSLLCRRLAAIVAAGFAGLFIAGLFFPQKLLTIDSGEVRGDALVVLGGSSVDRTEQAAVLFKEGAALKIIVTGRGDWKKNAALLQKNGVPPSAILEERRATDTLENAEFSLPLLRQLKARRAILVTTWYHSRRTLACFEHFAPDIVFYSRPSYFEYPRGWTAFDPEGDAARELVKIPEYLLRYGVRPFCL